MDNMKATIIIDLKWGRVRIYKDTLHLLNDPKYIQLLGNIDTKELALRPASPNDRYAERIRWERINKNHCCELYSYTFTDILAEMSSTLNKNSSYKLEGKILKNNIILFNIANATSFTE